jgi:hypothetical protein
MKRLVLLLISSSCLGMNQLRIEDGVSQEEYFCEIAMQVYHKKTSFECSPELKPYILRTLDYSRHNGESHKFASMVKELTKEDEDFLMSQVNKSVAAALRDQKQQIDSRITRKNAAQWVAIGGFLCTAITTAITLGTTLSGNCPK